MALIRPKLCEILQTERKFIAVLAGYHSAAPLPFRRIKDKSLLQLPMEHALPLVVYMVFKGYFSVCKHACTCVSMLLRSISGLGWTCLSTCSPGKSVLL